MALLGTFAYHTAEGLLQEISVRQLDALAESKKRDLVKVQEGWRDQLRLIRSRSDLRQSVQAYLADKNPLALAQVNQIIVNAVTATDNLEQIVIKDLQGKAVASYGEAEWNDASGLGQVPPLNEPQVITLEGSYFNVAGDLRLVFSSLLSIDGVGIGHIQVVFDGQYLFSITGNYTGLGETGETLVVKQDLDAVTVLNPLRHPASAASKH